MNVILDLPKPIEDRIEEEAKREGVTVGELVSRALAERYSPAPVETAQALALIDVWIAEAPTSPEAIRDAEEDLAEFQRSVNATRRAAGSVVTYPEAE